MAVLRCPDENAPRPPKNALIPPGLTLARSRDRLVIRYLSHGRIVFSKPPRKRGPAKHPTTQQQVAIWDLVLVLINVVDGSERAIALCESQGTAFYARDILIMAAYGNYVSWPGFGLLPQGPPLPDA